MFYFSVYYLSFIAFVLFIVDNLTYFAIQLPETKIYMIILTLQYMRRLIILPLHEMMETVQISLTN